MKFIVRAFAPTRNRRLNELVGLLLFASAILLFFALISYSPLDPSFNTAASLVSQPARNWIGVIGALISDLLLQLSGITIFLAPLMVGLLASCWFKSRLVASPIAKTVGAITLLIFVPAFLGLLPWHFRWRSAIPVEGLLGRISGDALIHYFNLVGAYIVCLSVISVALYLSTAFSLRGARVWLETRFGFAFAACDRLLDWWQARARAKAQKELERKRTAKPFVTTQAFAARNRPADAVALSGERVKTGIERLAEEEAREAAASAAQSDADPELAALEVGKRADSGAKPKTTMPRIAG